jgi:hypothetical protein
VKNSCKFCWAISLLLIIAVGAMAYMFVIRGNVTESKDGRTAIILSPGERDLVLGEMRDFLEAVQAITEALAAKDMKIVAGRAKKVGMASAGGVPVTLMTKLPLEFKTLGMSTHKAFDDLSVEATDMGDVQVSLGKLAELLNNCTTCHAAYRLEADNSGDK